MKRLLLVLIVLAIFAVAGHQWGLRYAKDSLTAALSEESGYPATVDSFQGFLPLGRVWLQDLKFKHLLPDGQAVDWRVPTAQANLGLLAYLRGSVEIQSLNIPKATWKTPLDKDWTLGGTLNLQGTSINGPTSQVDKDYLWCERALLTLPSVQGQFKNKIYDLVYGSSLEVAPFCLKGGDFTVPFKFSLAVDLTESGNAACLLAKGQHFPAEKRLQVDLRLVDIEVPVLERYLGIATHIPDFPKLEVADWIQGGSVSVQLRASADLKGVKGDLTLRLRKVQFGPEVVESELTGETLRPILDSIQTREDTLQLGPVSFAENLLTPKSEAWEQIQQGMVAELIKNDPAAALKTGVKMLQDFFGK